MERKGKKDRVGQGREGESDGGRERELEAGRECWRKGVTVVVTVIWTYQVIEDVSLMYVYCDECLVLGSFHLGELSGRHLNQSVQDVEELLVGVGHDLFVGACL